MGGEFRLKQISISGFRGYSRAQEAIDLSGSVVILMGGNRSGKSSTLNALEWALYGDEIVSAGKVDIDERKGWLVVNRYSPEARVELVLASGAGEVKIIRQAAKGRKKKGQGFCYFDERGNRFEDERSLWNKLGLGPRDFMSSVYLHQEIIRDILVTTPAVRKEALDRLLGVAHLRNLFDGFKQIRTKDYEKKITGVYQNLDELVSTIAVTHRKRIEEETENAEAVGLDRNELTHSGFQAKVKKTLRMHQELAQEAEVKIPEISPPSCPAEYGRFSGQFREEANRLRSENPASRSRLDLDREAEALDAVLSAYRTKVGVLKEKRDEQKELEDEIGTLEEIDRRKKELQKSLGILKARLASISDRFSVVIETIIYLEGLEDRRAQSKCPACQQDIIPEQVLAKLLKWKEESQKQTQTLETDLKQTGERIRNLDGGEKSLREIIEGAVPDAEKAVRTAKGNLQKALGRRLGEQEDPEVAVKKRLEEIQAELEKNTEVLKKYLDKISKLETEAGTVDCIGKVLVLEEKIKGLNDIRKCKEWKELDGAREGLNAKVEKIEKAKEAISSVLGERSEKKILETREQIRNIYRKLVQRPDFEWIEIDPENYDVYAVAEGDRDREKLLTFFNQGDMNCAALSIFLALGAGPKGNGGMGFLMLDDPSQSLDSEQKVLFARLLGDIAKHKQILLSTMDEELYQCLKEEIPRRKKIYTFGKWTPEKGPSISQE